MELFDYHKDYLDRVRIELNKEKVMRLREMLTNQCKNGKIEFSLKYDYYNLAMGVNNLDRKDLLEINSFIYSYVNQDLSDKTKEFLEDYIKDGLPSSKFYHLGEYYSFHDRIYIFLNDIEQLDKERYVYKEVVEVPKEVAVLNALEKQDLKEAEEIARPFQGKSFPYSYVSTYQDLLGCYDEISKKEMNMEDLIYLIEQGLINVNNLNNLFENHSQILSAVRSLKK